MPTSFRCSRPALAALVLTGLAGLTYVISVSADPGDTIPNGKHIGTKEQHDNNGNGNGSNNGNGNGNDNGNNGNSRNSGNGISYHGGPVLTNGSNVYYIWYGPWGSNTATSILPALANGLGGSPYFNINTTYRNGSNVAVQNIVNLAGQCSVGSTNYKQTLTDADVQTVVANALGTGGCLAYDSRGVYFVLTAPGIKESSGFCTQYCGWHTHFNWNGNDVKYAFVGDADNQCASSCQEQTANSPNNNPGADGMASVIAHELEEATTDPDLNAWYDNRGYENADKCAWTFGSTSTAGNGSIYNMILGGRSFLIQQNWVNASGGYCALKY
jgi:hypothetical protein